MRARSRRRSPDSAAHTRTSQGPWALALRRLRRDRAGQIFGSVSLLILLALLAAPLYASHVADTTPNENHLTDTTVIDGEPTFVVSLEGVPIGPTWEGSYFLGADENGRDLMVRVLYGARNSLAVGAGAVLLTVLLAVPLALAAGYRRGKTDAVIGRLFDLLWSVPALLMGVLLSTSLTLHGVDVGPFQIGSGSKLIPILVIGLVYVPYIARPLRGQVLALREQPFVDAARASGMRPSALMASELVPHLWSTLLVLATLLLVYAVALEVALSFLGAGINPPEPSLGTLIDSGLDRRDVMFAPHLLLAPCIALVLVVAALSGFAEALRRALDPHGTLGAYKGGAN
jgi:peptide/nickel transport system permease protein